MRRQKVLSAVFLSCSFTYSQMGEVFKESPAVVIDAVVLQHEQLAHVPRCDVTGNFYRSADVIFIINFNNLCKKKKKIVSIEEHKQTWVLICCRAERPKCW